MLLVITFTDTAIGAALVHAVSELRVRIAVDDDVVNTVRRLEFLPQLIVVDSVVTFDFLVQRGHQLLVSLAQRTVVIVAGDRRRRLQPRQGHKHQQEVK